MPDRKGAPPRAWQRMLSGRRLDLLDPSPLDIELGDVAHGLARVARWNGQTRGDHAFSVAQHSLLVERILLLREPDAPARQRLATLVHDAPEYVIGDIISPLKAVLDEGYRSVEARLLAAVHVRFGLPAVLPDAMRRPIKRADQAAAYFEAVRLAGFSEAEALQFFGQPDAIEASAVEEFLTPWPAGTAESRYFHAVGAVAELRQAEAAPHLPEAEEHWQSRKSEGAEAER